MFKKVTGKTLSLILAVMMLVSLLPLSAAAASIKAADALDGFTAEQLATTYTSTNQFKTANVTAPWALNGIASVSAQPKKDADGVEYLNIAPSAANSIYGGILVSDADLNIGNAEGQNSTFTFSTKIRKASTSGDMYLTLIDANGSRYNNYFLRIWRGSGRLDYLKGSSYCNAGLGNLAAGTWYDITITWDLKNNKMILNVDGGAFNNANVTITDLDAVTTTAPITGVQIGWNGTPAVDAGWDFDIAEISFANYGSTTQIAKDELLFENSTLGEHAAKMDATKWTDGNWDIEKWIFSSTYGANKVEVVSTGDSHDYAMKLTGAAGQPHRMNYTFDTAVTDKLVIEAATKDAGDGNGQFRLQAEGKYILYGNDTTGNTMQFCGETAEDKLISEPVSTDWVRTRVILDLVNDTAEVSYWSEGNPTDIVTYTSTGSANVTGLSSISTLKIQPYGKTAETELYVDNISVSSGSVTLFAEDVAPANGATKVPVSTNPSMAFNAPVKVADIFTLTDSDGNEVDGTTSLTADGCGLAFYPAEDLKPAETYTLTANGTVTDVFGDTTVVNETITFTTDDVISVNSVAFAQNGAPVEGSVVAGDLTATVDITSCDGAARDILVLMGLYDSETKELKDFDVDYQNTADYDHTLTVTVPENGSYYPVVYIWNNYSSLKPYVAPITLD